MKTQKEATASVQNYKDSIHNDQVELANTKKNLNKIIDDKVNVQKQKLVQLKAKDTGELKDLQQKLEKKINQEHSNLVQYQHQVEDEKKKLSTKIQNQTSLIQKTQKENTEMKEKIHSMTHMSKSLVQSQETELADTKVRNQELMKEVEHMKQKLIDSDIECPKKTMATVEANKQRWDQETSQKIEEVLMQADERMKQANTEWDAKLKKANDEIKVLETQVNGFAVNYEESAVQVE